MSAESALEGPEDPDSTDQPLGRRERKKLQTRRALENAAFTLFRDKGYDETTLLDITELADVAPRTFFRYFASKDEVILGSPSETAALLTAALASRPPDEPVLDSIQAALAALDPEQQQLRDPVLREHLLLRFQIIETSDSVRAGLLQSYTATEQCLCSFVAERTGMDPRFSVRPQMVAAAVTAALRVALSTWAAADGKGDLPAMFDEAMDVVRLGCEALEPPTC